MVFLAISVGAIVCMCGPNVTDVTEFSKILILPRNTWNRANPPKKMTISLLLLLSGSHKKLKTDELASL